MREQQKDKNGLIDMINTLKQTNITLLEIGSYAGESAEIFLDTGKVNEIICVDPWSEIDADHPLNSYHNMTEIERQFDSRMSRFGNCKKFKGTIDSFISSDLFKHYAGKIDIVYIDAMHTYESCLNDIRKTLDVISPNIAIAGHDYSDTICHVVGVKKAVDEVFIKPDYVFCDTSWLKIIGHK